MTANRQGKKLVSMFILVALAMFVFCFEAPAAGDWKPTKQIQFVVPYGPGGGSDVFARSIESIIKSEKLGPERFMVVNQTGGSGTVGTTSVSQASGNEHMLVTFISSQLTSPMLAGKGAATYRDLTLIANLALDEQLIIVKPDSPFKSIADVVAAAKKQTLKIAGTAVGGEDHMCTRLFEKAADIKLRFIPFNSGSECIVALLGGNVDMIWANPGEFIPQYEAKLVRPIAVAKDSRLPFFKDVPTFKEQGYDVTFYFFRGIAAPPKISPEAVAHYDNLLKRLSESTAWKENYLQKYMLSPYYLGSKEYGPFVAKYEKIFTEILKELGLLK